MEDRMLIMLQGLFDHDISLWMCLSCTMPKKRKIWQYTSMHPSSMDFAYKVFSAWFFVFHFPALTLK